MAKALLELYPEGAKVQKKNGNLPLHSACEEGAADKAKVLLEVYPWGAKVQKKNGNCHSIPLAKKETLT